MGTTTIIGPLVSSLVELPYYSTLVPAGFASPAIDHLEQKISLDALLDIEAPHTYLVRAGGDSMIGVGIFDKDILIVNKALDVRHRDIIIAVINGDLFVKRFTKAGEQIVLVSENPKYPPRFVMEGDVLEVWGVVTESLRRHRLRA